MVERYLHTFTLNIKKTIVTIINMSNNLAGDAVILNLKPYILITAFLKLSTNY